MTSVDQRFWSCRCEWGVRGLSALAPADVVIVVDVLSFSTCVDIAVSRGAALLPFAHKERSARTFARRHGAELAGARGAARYSLSPASFLDAPAGLRCVLPSPNGATLVAHASHTRALVLAGCLRNASAVATAARRAGSTFNVCPAGERWPDDSTRFALEDWLGAGAILAALPGDKSPEARAAVRAFESARPRIRELVARTSSGRDLIERGFPMDVALATSCDVSRAVPRLEQGTFRNDDGQNAPSAVRSRSSRFDRKPSRARLR